MHIFLVWCNWCNYIAEITEEAIIEMAGHVDVLRPSDLSREYAVSRNTVSRRLNALVRKKLLKRYGKGAGVFYELSQKNDSTFSRVSQ